MLDAVHRQALVLARVAQVGDGGHLHAGLRQVARRVDAEVVGGDDDGPLAGHDPKLVHEPAGGGAEHDAGQVVSAEDEGLLDHARRDDDLGGAEPEHRVALVDGDEVPLVDAPGPRGAQDLDAGLAGLRCEVSRPLRCGDAREGQPPAERQALVDEGRLAALSRSGDRRLEARLAAADDEHVDVAVHLLESPGAPVLGVELAEPGRASKELLVVLPGPTRPDERLVVEADLHPERGRGAAHGVQRVGLERRPGVDRVDLHALLRGRHAGADGRFAVDLDEAVGALAGAAQEAARAVVLERAREDLDARVEERRGDRVAREARHLLAAPSERHGRRAVDQLAAPLCKPAHASPPGGAVWSTVFERVSRSAWNHSRQPDE